MSSLEQLVTSRAVGDAMELQCLADNLARYATVTGKIDVLRDAKQARQIARRIAQAIDGEAA